MLAKHKVGSSTLLTRSILPYPLEAGHDQPIRQRLNRVFDLSSACSNAPLTSSTEQNIFNQTLDVNDLHRVLIVGKLQLQSNRFRKKCS